MGIAIRIVALWVAFVAMAAPLRLALWFALSVEPDRSVRLGYLLPFGLTGLAMAAGYIGLAAFPRVFARAGVVFRVVGFAMLVAAAMAAILVIHSVSSMMAQQTMRAIFSLLVCMSTALGSVWLLLMTVWPGWFNLRIRRTESTQITSLDGSA